MPSPEHSNPRLVVLEGAESSANAVAVDPRGRTVLAGHEDGTLWHWDLIACELLTVLEEHRDPVWSLVMIREGEDAVSGSDEGRVVIWWLPGESPELLYRHRGLAAVDASPNGRWIVSRSWDGSVRVFDTQVPGRQKWLKGQRTKVTAMAVLGPGNRLVTGHDDGTLGVWDLSTRKEIFSFQAHRGAVSALARHGPGDEVLSAGEEGSVLAWKLREAPEGRELIQDPNAAAVRRLAVSRDGVWAAGVFEDEGVLRIWDLGTGCRLHEFSAGSASPQDATFLPDGRRLISAWTDGALRIWNPPMTLHRRPCL